MTIRDLEYLKDLSREIRADAFKTIRNAKSGHLGACSSSVELMTALYFGGILNYNPNDPSNPSRDRVYVRGHIGPLRYKIFSLLNWINEEELSGYRTLGSRLKGHECMHSVPGVDMSPSGSLGMLLSYATGSALITRQKGLPSMHYVFLGDGEEQEGNVSEAARHIGSLGLPNIICILDKNGKQLSRPTNEVDSSDVGMVWKGYGWDVLRIENGHDFSEILSAYDLARKRNKPVFIIANTTKGYLIDGCENHFNGFHTIGALKEVSALSSAIELGSMRADRGKLERILQEKRKEFNKKSSRGIPDENREYLISIPINPENSKNMDSAQGDYFFKLMVESKSKGMPLFFITPDLIHESDVQDLRLRDGSTYIDTGLREQHTVAMAHGISQTDKNARIFINYFDAFLYRASDQLNAAAQGRSKFLLLSELSGITQGKNGQTHQASGVSAVPLFMPGTKFYEPADVQDMYNVFDHFFSTNEALTIVRTHKANVTRLIREKREERNIDFYKVFESDSKPDITLIGSGFVVPNLVEAAKQLEVRHAIGSRVINAINLKGLENSKFLNLIENDRPVLTVYNGNAEILKSLVASAVFGNRISRPSTIHGHGFNFGETGSIEDLIKHFSFDSESLEALARRIVKDETNL